MTDIIRKEAEALAALRVTDDYVRAAQLLQDCQGRVVATGIGKAGFIARKFASTLSSTGTPALFVHPAEAGHGDLGMLCEDDCIVAFSTSGKSNEVIEMLEIAAKFRGCAVIGVTSHLDSPLRALSQVVLDMGADIQEACSLGLTPSASIAVMLAVSDALALTLMDLKGFTAAGYHQRHHRGYLGAKSRPPRRYDSDGAGQADVR